MVDLTNERIPEIQDIYARVSNLVPILRLHHQAIVLKEYTYDREVYPTITLVSL